MAPKLPTLQIFKGSAYELKYRAYRFCLNKKQANLLLYLGVIFSKLEKIITYLKFARIQTLPLRMHQKHNSWIHFTWIFLCVAETHAIFLNCFPFSSDVPLRISRGLIAYLLNDRNQNNSGAKALRILIFLWRSKIQLSVTSSYIQKWISPTLSKHASFVKFVFVGPFPAGYSTNIRVYVRRWGFETVTPSKTEK